MQNNSSYIKELAKQTGFDACGIAQATHLSLEADYFKSWLKRGYHADMGYLENYFEKRFQPELLVENTRSIISILVNYNPQKIAETPFKIAKYAYGEDYHRKIKKMLLEFISTIRMHFPHFEARAFVDTAPVPEKAWAVRSGLGWIGKNSLLIHPVFGSYCFLGELYCNLELEPDKPISNSCGSCSLCIQACPNGALDPLNGLDARKCSSYHTIENKSDTLPESIQLKGYIVGCDCCQDRCPYNQKTPQTNLLPNQTILQLGSGKIDEKIFKTLIKRTAVDRIKYYQYQRNIKHGSQTETKR